MIRLAGDDDLPAIVGIYNQSIPGRMATADTAEVTVESRREWLAQHGPTRPLWVDERDGVVAAWCSFGDFYGRPAYAGTAEVSIYVAPDFQRQGIAAAFLQHALDAAPDLGVTTLLGFIFGHNTPSLALFARFGFTVWGTLPDVAVLDGLTRDLVIVGKRC